eukprot:c6752_g1_i1 orf=1-309(-)
MRVAIRTWMRRRGSMPTCFESLRRQINNLLALVVVVQLVVEECEWALMPVNAPFAAVLRGAVQTYVRRGGRTSVAAHVDEDAPIGLTHELKEPEYDDGGNLLG